MNPIRISATIITFNEEERIHDCIASVHDWCDEVLVLDSHSTDGTLKVARGFPKVRIETHDFDGHVQQKNRAIDLARGEWVFCLDADERATPELARSVVEFVHEHPEAYGARVPRLNHHLGTTIRYGGWYNKRHRLVRKGFGVWGGENPHDVIELKDGRAGPVLKGDLIHFSFRDLSHQVDTLNKFSSIVAFSRVRRGVKSSLLKMVFKPWGKFIEIYFLKLGFLDGMAGLITAINTSYAAFLRFAKIYEMHRTGLERPTNVRADYQPQEHGQ